jgi:ribosomal protein L29
MSSNVTTTELRTMNLADLSKETQQQKFEVAKLSMHVCMQKEKNVAKYKTAKKKLAQMNTVLTEKRKEQLQTTADHSKVSAPSA